MFRGSFVLHDLRSEVVVRFVDISVIVEHPCLNFLFMKYTRNLVNRQKWFYRFSLFSVKAGYYYNLSFNRLIKYKSAKVVAVVHYKSQLNGLGHTSQILFIDDFIYPV